MSPITRRRFLLSGAVAGAGLALRPRRLRAQTAVKVATAVLGDYSLAGPFILAQERGLFANEGLTAEFLPFRGGPDLVKAVVAGDILVAASGSTDILVFREAGLPIKMIGTHTEGNHFTLNVAPEIQRVADLKGKTIGVTRVGATTWIFARMLARKEGWDADRDVKIVGLGGLDAQLAALARKEIHAYVWGDGGAVTEQQGKSRVLMRLDAVTPAWISQILYASEDGIRAREDAIRKVLRAVFLAQRLMRTKTEEAAEIISRQIGWSPQAVLGAHKISGTLLSETGQISMQALAAIQDTLIEYAVIKKRLPLEDHVAKAFTPVRL
jgi:NitT/TauT family transport system substrate-binding protein